MVLIIILIITFLIFAVIACILLSSYEEGGWLFFWLAAGIFTGLGFAVTNYLVAEANVKIFNAKYHTEYTQTDWFYSGDLIRSMELTLPDSKQQIDLDIK